MKTTIRNHLASRKRQMERRLDKTKLGDCSQPMFTARNIDYEFSKRVRGLAYGGIGIFHRLARRIGLIDAIDQRLHFREECEYGMGYVNLPWIGAEVHLPFGGVKKSGNGHPSAAGLIEAVTYQTAWTVNHAEEVKMAQGLTTDVD